MMKLSEAIRLGSMLKPQKRDGYGVGTKATCAVGAACEAIGITDRDDIAGAEHAWDTALCGVFASKRDGDMCSPE